MKTNPLIYIVGIGIAIVVLLMLLADRDDDPLLPTPHVSSESTTSPNYLSEDRDNPSEAVKAVGSQINRLRAEQSAFEQSVNQTVEQINRQLQTLHSAIKKIAEQQNDATRDLRSSLQEGLYNRNPNLSASGSEPVAPSLPSDYQDTPDFIPAVQPTWLWIEDQSVAPSDVGNSTAYPTDTLSKHLGLDAIVAVSEYGSELDTVSLIIPPATVIQALTLTAAIGRLPVRGQLNEPWPVKVISTVEGYAPNGYAVDAAQMIWDGKAFGDANFECVRVILTRVTSVLPGKVVAFVEAADTEKGLGYLSDAGGHPCLKGKLVSNAAKQMTAEAILGIAQGIGEGYADTQRTRTVSPEGNTVESVTGEEMRVLIGQGFSKSVNNVRNYLASRYDVWDAIYVAPEQQVVINVDQPLEFVYDTEQKLYDGSNFAFKIGDDTGTRLD